METDWFTFQARLERVIDGDTVDLLVDLGFRTRKRVRVRIQGVDTEEIYGVEEDSEEFRRGKRHAEFARSWFEAHAGDEAWPLILSTEKDHGKYGRWPERIVSKETGTAYREALVNEFPDVAV
ncbi:MAG: thermonuclease family protein [Salinibacter sp.]